ncbi:MAG: hypothetical protein M3Y39_15285 [Chloroflexota bacterium]|nr:hypothetical protein [Chloroflexota bacterium]
MFTQAEASAFCEKINKEFPDLDVQIKPEEQPYKLYYYLVISQKGKAPFVVRSEEQWQERKHLVITG